MKIRYIVHSCVRQPYQMSVMAGKNEVVASVDGLVMELVNEDKSSSFTVRSQPADIAAAEELFAPGTVVEVSLKPVSE